MYRLWIILLAWIPLSAFDPIDSKYTITYGDNDAPIEIVEYFSFSCPKCTQLYTQEFADLKSTYIDIGIVKWVFHPDPTDKLTLQAMVCLETLATQQKQLLLEGFFSSIQDLETACQTLQKASAFFGNPLPDLNDLEYLKSTPAFIAAYDFLKQQPEISDIPTVQINGKIYDDMPTKAFIKEKLKDLLQEEAA